MIGRRIAALLVTLLVVAGCGSAAVVPYVTAAGERRVEVTFANGTVAGGVTRYAVPVGSPVELVVTSDVADEVHVHGYDVSADVPAGGSATVHLTANLPGVFEVELEQRHVPLAELEVS